MQLPFTTGEFLEVFRRYNEAVWPAQWILLALGLAAIVLAVSRAPYAGRAASLVLASLWLWMGVVYHLIFFRPINQAATGFGVAFVVQAALLAWLGAWRGALRFRPRADAAGVAGALALLYALAVYPALAYLLGHRYPATPTFGLPCPTTILTFGLLLWAEAPVPRRVVVIPALWAALGTVAASQLGMREDLGLLVAGLVGTAAVLVRRSPSRPPTLLTT